MAFLKSFLRTSKHSRFNYQPIYYDPLEEEKKNRQAKKDRIKFEKGSMYKNARSPIVGAFSDRHSSSYQERTKYKQKQVIRTVLVAACLLLILGLGIGKLDGLFEGLF